MPRLTTVLRFAIASAAMCALASCDEAPASPAKAAADGDSARGIVVITRVGCGACHNIPGIEGANGLVGPPLDRMGARTIIAGMLPNTSANMIAWVKSPQTILPGNAMPNTGLTDEDARDVAAYLSTLR